MAQQLNLGHALPCKLQPLILYSLDPSTLSGSSFKSRTGVQNKKGDLTVCDSATRKHSQEDCPDGGLQAWLVVLGVRLPVWMSLWMVINRIL